MTKTISFRVSAEYDHQIRVVAAQLDMNRSDFIRVALDAKLVEAARELGINTDNETGKGKRNDHELIPA